MDENSMVVILECQTVRVRGANATNGIVEDCG